MPRVVTNMSRFVAAGVLGLVLLLLGGLFFWDEAVRQFMMMPAAKEWRPIAGFFSRYGDFPYLLGAGVVLLAVALRMRSATWSRMLVAMILAAVIAGLASNVIKLGTGRVRPRVIEVEQGWYGPKHRGEWVSLRHEFQGFPSSHAACAFGFFVPLFLSRRRAGTIGLVVAALISWSRVQLNAHYISDIAAGALLGLLVGWLVWRWIVAGGGLARWLSPPVNT